MLSRVARVVAAALWLGVLTGSVAARDIPGLSHLGESEAGEVIIDAEHVEYDQRANVVTARGAVKITRGDMTLTADTVEVNRTTQVANAKGNVVVVDPQGTLSADVLTLDLVQETGSMDEGAVFLNANRYQLSGQRFEKSVGQSYRVVNGRFTTCVCKKDESPSWSIRGQRITLDLEGYGRVKGGTFAVHDVPILYVPYGIFPVRRERQTGLLFPRFGYSNRRGFQFEQPLFLNFNKSHDATVSVDLETKARVGALAEYRYALSPDTLGEVSGSYFNESIRGASSEDVVNTNIADPNIPIDRWSAGMTHDQWLPYGFKGYADVLRVSDDLFLREINVFTFNPGVDVALRTRRFERSRLAVERVFDDGLLLATSTWYQDFINPDRYVFQAPPRFDAWTQSRFFDDRVLVSFTGGAVNYTRDRGYDGQRIDLRPEVELPWRYGSFVRGSFRGGFRETAYHLEDTSVPTQVNTNPADPGSQPPSILPALDQSASRELFYLRGDVGTAVSRVYPFERFGLVRLKHTIEPEVGYLFVPRTDTRQAALPLFDDVDRVNQRSVATYGVTSRVLGRLAAPPSAADHTEQHRHSVAEHASLDGTRDESEALGTGVEAVPTAAASGGMRELARFSLFQSYDFANASGDFIDEVDPDTGEVLRGKGSRASDLSVYLRLTPSPFLSFEGRTDYSVTGEGTKSATVGLFLTDWRAAADDFELQALRGRTRVGIGYRFVANQAVEEVNGSMLVRFMKQLYGAYEARYDNRSGRFLEHRYGLRFVSKQECWVVDLGVSDRVNPDETEVRFLVSLVGLAQFGKEPFRQSLGAIAAPVHGFMGE
ncbi:MAG: LPS-assembly protein LptD [Deltaproteobacteria bacterium]|nr:LPS-assembly protein LptD [Deltaproteobacteria bacterium]